MAAFYKIDKERRIVLSTLSGELTYAELLAQQRNIAADPDFDPTFAHIVDFTYATLAKIAPEHLLKFAQRSVLSPNVSRAAILPNLPDYELERMYETLRGLEGQTGGRAFLTLEDAMDWIARPSPNP